MSFLAFFLSACGDGGTCNDCSCNPSLCDGGGGDGDDGGGDTTQYGSLTVTATAAGVEANADINLDGQPSGFQTPHTFENLLVGMHSVLLSYPGRLQAPSPMEVNVTQEGTDVNIILYRDLTGKWRREGDGIEVNVVMQILESSDRYACPDTPTFAGPYQPLSGLCVEADDSLSLCKTHASECTAYVEGGQITEDGRRVEFQIDYGLGPNPPIIYRRVD